MRHFAVIGGAGYIGGAVVDEILDVKRDGRRHTVMPRVYDCLVYEETYRKQVNFIYGDIRDRARLEAAIDICDAVIWLAALVGDPACQRYPELSVAINQEPLRWLAENYTGRIVFTSTCSVYGNAAKECTEGTPTNPLSVYAETKLAAEHHLRKANAIIFRLGTLFGVGDLFSRVRLDLVVNALTVKAHQTGAIPIYGGNQVRPLLHVSDAARMIVDAVDMDQTGIYNLHYDNMTMTELGLCVQRHYKKAAIVRHPMQLGDRRDYGVSSEKARHELDFVPAGTVDVGIQQMKGLLDSRRLKDTSNPRFCNGKFMPMGAVAALEAFRG